LHRFRDQPGTVVPTLLKALKDKDELVRREAATRSRSFVNEKEIVLALIQALDDPAVAPSPGEMSVAQLAADSLGCPGPHRKLAVAALTEAARAGGDERVRYTAIWTLGFIAAKEEAAAPTVVPLLIEALKDAKEKGRNRAIAAHALSLIGPRAKAAVPALRAIVLDQKAEDADAAFAILGNALVALRSIGPDARDAVPELIAILGDKFNKASHRQLAAEALGNIGHAAKSALPTLRAVREAVRELDRVREAATTALLKIQQ
jgi:HEAT repeat protein